MSDEVQILNQEKNERLELYKEIIADNYDTNDILAKTELSGKEIPLFAYGHFLVERTENPIIQSFMENLLIGKLSLKRQSRKEANDKSKALLQSNQEEAQKPTLGEHLIGARKY